MRPATLVLCAALIVAPVRECVAQRTEARAPLDWPLLTLDGARRSLEAFRGRVVLVNSWATWCEPCVAELRSLAELRASMPDTSLVFALVASQQRAPVAAFVRRRQLTLPVYLAAAPAPAVYAFDAVPTTWLIDRRGAIRLRHRGAADWNTPAMRERLAALLAESP